MKKPQSLIPSKLNFEGWNKKINYIKGSEIKKIVIKIMRVKIEIKYKLESNQNFLIKNKKQGPNWKKIVHQKLGLKNEIEN
jgi:hypothetical protein